MGKHGCSSCVWKETHTEGDLNIGMTRISTVCLNHLDRDRQRSLKQIVRISGFYICPLTARIQWWLNPQFTSSRISPSSDFVSSAYCRSKLLQNRTWDPFLNIAFEYNSELCGATTSDLLLLIVNNWPFFVVVGFFFRIDTDFLFQAEGETKSWFCANGSPVAALSSGSCTLLW